MFMSIDVEMEPEERWRKIQERNKDLEDIGDNGINGLKWRGHLQRGDI